MGNYVVKQGDTIWGIAKSLGIPTADLVKWNNLESNPNNIQVGQALKLSADDTDNSFEYDDYQESDVVTGAKNALDTHLAQKPGEYNSQWQAQLDDTINKILNREKFSYDLNGDVLYQQYKDKYIKQGKMAMGDAIGQASAMTGGYGNSYAQSVGQQAYQAQLENLNDIVPELYQMAYDKYNQEGQDLYNQYSMLGDRENMDYGRYRDTVGDWQNERGYLTDRYDTERNFDYGQYSDDRDLAYSEGSGSGSGSGSGTSSGKDNTPKESAQDYADWEYGDWEGYFATIRNTEGKSAAEQELSRMNKAGLIPKEFIVAASIGARGSLGH